MFAFFEMLMFVVLILAGFFYIWKKGALDWAEPTSPRGPAESSNACEMLPEQFARTCPWPSAVDAFRRRRDLATTASSNSAN